MSHNLLCNLCKLMD